MTNSSHRNVRPHSDLQGAHSWLSSFRVSQSEKKKTEVTQSCLTLCDPMDYTYSPWDSPGQSTGMGNPFPSPGDLPNPGIRPKSPALQTLYCQSHQGSSRILEWVAIPFSRASFWNRPRNRTGVPPLRVDSLPAELPRKPRPSQSFLCPSRS